MRWTLDATAQRRHRLDMTTTSLSPLSLHATVREPLGLVTVSIVSTGMSNLPAVSNFPAETTGLLGILEIRLSQCCTLGLLFYVCL